MTAPVERSAVLDPYRVTYRDAGSGFPVVLIHGFSGPDCWNGVVERLAPRYRCVVWSPLGMGDADGSLEGDYGMAGQGSLLCRFLDSVGIRRAHVVGHDTGGAVAQALAAYAPQYVETLTLSDCDALDNWPPTQLKLLRAALGVPGLAWLVAESLRLPSVARGPLGFGKLYRDRQLLTASRVAALRRPFEGSQNRERFRRLLAEMDARHTLAMVPRLGEFARPSLVIWGRHNAYWSTDWAGRLAAVLGGAPRVSILEECGLTGCEEAPDLFASTLLDFWGDSAAPRPAATQPS